MAAANLDIVLASGVPGLVGCVSGGPSILRLGVVLNDRTILCARLGLVTPEDCGPLLAVLR